MIYVVRGDQVMLDADLASLYQVETKALLQAVKRNPRRFPNDFVFQLTPDECDQLNLDLGSRGVHGGRRYRPYAFTEQGAGMIASVLRNSVAARVAISILRAFGRLRKDDDPEPSEDPGSRKTFAAIRDAFLLQWGDEEHTTPVPCTYFVQVGDDGPIKIGSTRNLAVRLRTLCAMFPMPLKLLGIMYGDVEERCHARFSAFRIRGEWFAPSPVVLDFIRNNAVIPPGH